ncbi:MAG: DUF2851 family protein [Tannerella sp.]|jgi:hypothetical protein|nr:DUF2851 family protein [Tannerella sp.]
MEKMLQYIWKHQLYQGSELRTADGEEVVVIDPGLQNADAGPDFFNAKVRIGDTIWAGNVEIHTRASEWVAHKHFKDKAYENVILHVVRYDDAQVFTSDDKPVTQAIMPVPPKIEENIEWLLSRDFPVPCAGRIREISSIYMMDWMTTLLMERLERKTLDIFNLLEQYSKDWYEAFYITLMRNFGFGTNSDICELLAKSLPHKYILKHRNNPLQVEALIFGQAGLLELSDVSDSYSTALRKEYDFLSKKYKLKPVQGFLFKKLRTRPVNFPHIRLAQAAAVWIKNDLLFSEIIETDDIDELKRFFNVVPSEYWLTHYSFNTVSAARDKSLGISTVNIILINTVVSMIFAYGKLKNLPEYCNKALHLLAQLPAEKNSIVTIFERAGINVRNAGDSQALIQLKREYCERKKCLYCRIGFHVIEN